MHREELLQFIEHCFTDGEWQGRPYFCTDSMLELVLARLICCISVDADAMEAFQRLIQSRCDELARAGS